ncbi:CDP-glucose 4,6-dehydratase [Cohnella mopanensis]|uniref:CDP-glucose 4,6-dehydratase n=1 Tax=Cohnella mopanensis TaxID=2911966 RepID=UPI001EF7FF48|nr:CDP-glucose 4,6-dehydratase [Cohnella mopanensis]
MSNFWSDKKVLLTGHTGFKGSWFTLWLKEAGAEVFGFALPPESEANLYTQASVHDGIVSEFGNLNDYGRLKAYVDQVAPDIVFHMAAQPLVRYSYRNPVETFQTNVMGTVHLLEALRSVPSLKAIVNVTSDKCYDIHYSSPHGFSENDRMGGLDPYSSSKGCSELVASAYKHSFYTNSGKTLSSVRAGNVIGGGDWAEDRIIPDLIRSVIDRKPLLIRNPNAIRPWQHVLDCLRGYMKLAEKMWQSGEQFAGAWNIGPGEESIVSVEQLVEKGKTYFSGLQVVLEAAKQPYETERLVLNCTKANELLGWSNHLSNIEAIEWTMEWYKAYMNKQDMREFTIGQIRQFIEHAGS